MGTILNGSAAGALHAVDHAESERFLQCSIRHYERVEASVSDLRAFFEEDADDLVVLRMDVNEMDLLMVHRALAAMLADWTIVRETAYDEDRPILLSHHAVEVAPEHHDYVVRDGRRFMESPAGDRMVVDIWCSPDRRHPHSHATFAVPRERHAWLRGMMEEVRRWMDANHFLRGQAFTAQGAFVKLDEVPAWEDVLIPDAVRARLETDCVRLLQHAPLYKANGIPLRRGIILHGKPGTGKTTIGRVLARMCGVTFILATPGMLYNAQVVRRVFEWGRRFAPSILFFEDFDMVARDREEGGGSGLLGEFLAGLDGIDSAEGIIAIATTNRLSAIEPALKDRPNRFDCVLEIPALSEEQRRVYVEKWIAKHPGSAVDAAAIARQAKECTGAQMQELCRQAVIASVEARIARGETSAERVALGMEDFRAAFDRMPAKHVRPIGFHAQFDAERDGDDDEEDDGDE